LRQPRRGSGFALGVERHDDLLVLLPDGVAAHAQPLVCEGAAGGDVELLVAEQSDRRHKDGLGPVRGALTDRALPATVLG